MKTASRSKIRRSASAALVAAGVGAMLAACSTSGGSGGAEPQTITLEYFVADSASTSPYAVMADAFMKSHKGVTVKLDPVSLETYGQTLTTALQGGGGPDVFYVGAGVGQNFSAITLAKAGLLGSLTASTVKALVPSQDKSLFEYNGNLIAMPTQLVPEGLLYNADGAKAAGVSATGTMEEVLADCATLKAKGKAMFGEAGKDASAMSLLGLEIAANEVYGPDPQWNTERAAGKVTFAGSAAWKRTLETVQQMQAAGCFQPGAGAAGDPALLSSISTQKVYANLAPGGYAPILMKQFNNGLKLEVAPFPARSGLKPYLIASPADALAVNAHTKSPKLSQEFLSWFAEPANAAKFADLSGDLPVSGVTASSKLSEWYQPIQTALVDKQYVPPATLSWPNGQIQDAMASGITGLLTGQSKVDDILKAMDAAWGN